MKTYIAVAVLACFTLGVTAHLTEEELAKIKEYQTECIKETGMDEDVLKKIEAGEKIEHPKLGDFAFCFMKKAEAMDEEGDYIVEKIKKFIAEKFDEAIAETVVSDCTKEKSATPGETAIKLYECLEEHKKKLEKD